MGATISWLFQIRCNTELHGQDNNAYIGDIMGVAKGRYPYVMDNYCSARSTLVIGLYCLPREQLADSPSAGAGIDNPRD